MTPPITLNHYITPSSSGYILVPLSNEGIAVRDGFTCSMVVDLLLEVGVAIGNGVLCSVVVRVGAGSLDHCVQIKLSTAAKNYSRVQCTQ